MTDPAYSPRVRRLLRAIAGAPPSHPIPFERDFAVLIGEARTQDRYALTDLADLIEALARGPGGVPRELTAGLGPAAHDFEADVAQAVTLASFQYLLRRDPAPLDLSWLRDTIIRKARALAQLEDPRSPGAC